MKYLIAAALAVSLLSASNANALGKREEGVLIGLGSAMILSKVYRNGGSGGYSGGYGGYGGTYGGYGYGNTDFPRFRCRGNSVDCAYQRGVWEREREVWLQQKDDAYMCGRYPEKCGGGRR